MHVVLPWTGPFGPLRRSNRQPCRFDSITLNVEKNVEQKHYRNTPVPSPCGRRIEPAPAKAGDGGNQIDPLTLTLSRREREPLNLQTSLACLVGEALVDGLAMPENRLSWVALDMIHPNEAPPPAGSRSRPRRSAGRCRGPSWSLSSTTGWRFLTS